MTTFQIMTTIVTRKKKLINLIDLSMISVNLRLN
jgi:hypothetical protein